MIVPIKKKGKGRKVEDYRGVTITSTLYKIYTSIIAERLREEIEKKKLIPPNQTGFRKGMGTMDNIYVLNYLINRQNSRRGAGSIVLFYVDLKAAFDSVDREKLVEALIKRGVDGNLVSRCKEVLRETSFRVKVGEEMGEEFWTEKGIRQGCPLSSSLFSLFIADLEEMMEKGGWGGVKLGGKKIYSLAYADDIVLLAEEEGGMRCLMNEIRKVLRRKRIGVECGKIKNHEV